MERRTPIRHVGQMRCSHSPIWKSAFHPRGGEPLTCDRLLLATGGCRAAAAGQLAVSLGHTLEPPVPSLFTFRIESPWLRSLAGISVGAVEVSVPPAKLRERGSLLVTHRGLSGPAILRLSAWGARTLHGFNYQFPLQVNWLPQLSRRGDCRRTQIAPGRATRASRRQRAGDAVASALVGTTRPGRRHRARHALGRALAGRATPARPAIDPHGIPGDGQKPEPGRICDVRGRAPGRGEFQDDGEQGLSRDYFSRANCWTLTA